MQVRPIEEREQVLNLYFHEGIGHKGIAKTTGIPLETVKSWCRRYRIANNIPIRGKVALSKDPVKKESIHVIKPRKPNTQEARIARLEMEVELLRNFLILAEEE
jgi:transposase